MKPDAMIAEVKKLTRLHFGTEHEGIQDAAAQLLDDGFLWEQIRPILSAAFSAGYEQADYDYGYRG